MCYVDNGNAFYLRASVPELWRIVFEHIRYFCLFLTKEVFHENSENNFFFVSRELMSGALIQKYVFLRNMFPFFIFNCTN